jgi:hypothetical protein
MRDVGPGISLNNHPAQRCKGFRAPSPKLSMYFELCALSSSLQGSVYEGCRRVGGGEGDFHGVSLVGN